MPITIKVGFYSKNFYQFFIPTQPQQKLAELLGLLAQFARP
jgi:hypothetical protein